MFLQGKDGVFQHLPAPGSDSAATPLVRRCLSSASSAVSALVGWPRTLVQDLCCVRSSDTDSGTQVLEGAC